MWLLVNVVLTLYKHYCFDTWEHLRKGGDGFLSTYDFELLQSDVSIQES